MATVLLRYDLRRPGFARASHADLYRACLEQCAWADTRGVSAVALSEHHGVDDGYLPSPLVLAGAIAARTENLLISISALLAPLHDPLRVAEDLAVLDIMSRGRVSIVAGLGYRDEEFEMFGVDRGKRGRILEENLRVMLQAWTGEPFEYRGRTVRVTPVPHTKPHPLVLAGGSTEPAARRAARLRLPMMPATDDPELAAIYEQACRDEGWDGGFMLRPGGTKYVHIAEDPDKAWAEVGPHMLHDATTYASWQPAGQHSVVTTSASTIDELKAGDVYKVVTPDECVELARHGPLILHPLVGGLDPELGWSSLELFDTRVRPRLAPS